MVALELARPSHAMGYHAARDIMLLPGTRTDALQHNHAGGSSAGKTGSVWSSAVHVECSVRTFAAFAVRFPPCAQRRPPCAPCACMPTNDAVATASQSAVGPSVHGLQCKPLLALEGDSRDSDSWQAA